MPHVTDAESRLNVILNKGHNGHMHFHSSLKINNAMQLITFIIAIVMGRIYGRRMRPLAYLFRLGFVTSVVSDAKPGQVLF
jgi:hypothetical protein